MYLLSIFPTLTSYLSHICPSMESFVFGCISWGFDECLLFVNKPIENETAQRNNSKNVFIFWTIWFSWWRVSSLRLLAFCCFFSVSPLAHPYEVLGTWGQVSCSVHDVQLSVLVCGFTASAFCGCSDSDELLRARSVMSQWSHELPSSSLFKVTCLHPTL